MALERAMIALMALALAGCGSGAASSGSGETASLRSAPRPLPPVRPPGGIESVLGASRAALIARFGAPRLDVREGDATKLQWSGTPCILDIYLYPPQPGAAATAAWVDARRGDGRDVDRAACLAALGKR